MDGLPARATLMQTEKSVAGLNLNAMLYQINFIYKKDMVSFDCGKSLTTEDTTDSLKATVSFYSRIGTTLVVQDQYLRH